MDDIALIGIVILLMWLSAIGYYFYVSRQQQTLAKEINELRDLLDESEDDFDEA